jgi:hypothetical protein
MRRNAEPAKDGGYTAAVMLVFMPTVRHFQRIRKGARANGIARNKGELFWVGEFGIERESAMGMVDLRYLLH